MKLKDCWEELDALETQGENVDGFRIPLLDATNAFNNRADRENLTALNGAWSRAAAFVRDRSTPPAAPKKRA